MRKSRRTLCAVRRAVSRASVSDQLEVKWRRAVSRASVSSQLRSRMPCAAVGVRGLSGRAAGVGKRDWCRMPRAAVGVRGLSGRAAGVGERAAAEAAAVSEPEVADTERPTCRRASRGRTWCTGEVENVVRERSCAAAVGGRAGRAVVADAAAEDPVNRIPALMMIDRTACCCDAKRRSCASRAATRYHEDAQARGRVPETRGRRGEDSARADNRASHATKVFRGHGTPIGRLRPPRRPSLQTTPAGHT